MQDFGNVSDYNSNSGTQPSAAPSSGAASGVQDFGNVSDYGNSPQPTQPQQSQSDSIWSRLVGVGKSAVDMGVNNLPAIGGSVGALVASPLAPETLGASSVVGAGLGGMIGEKLKEKIQGTTTNPGAIMTQGVLNAAGEGVGGVLSRGVMGAGKAIAEASIPKTPAEALALQSYKAGNTFWERVGRQLTGTQPVSPSGKVGVKIVPNEPPATTYSTGDPLLPGYKTSVVKNEAVPTIAPETGASVAFDKGIYGTASSMGAQAQRQQKSIWDSVIEPALSLADKTGEKANVPSVIADTRGKIGLIADPTRRNALLEALDGIEKDFHKEGTTDVSWSRLQKIKEGWAEPVPESSYAGKPISSAVNEVRAELAATAREHIYKQFGPDVQQAYNDYGNLTSLKQLGQKSEQQTWHAPNALTMNWLNHAVAPIGTIAGHTIYNLGRGALAGAHFIGPASASTLGEVLGSTQDQYAPQQ